MKTVWTIAGFDPSSGAGVTADLQVFAAHRLFGCSCITALTVQSTVGVSSVHPVDAGIVRATLEQLQDDLPPTGIKIGMLATAEIVTEVVAFLEKNPTVLVVLDPVLRSSSGKELLSAQGLAILREQLLPRVAWVTPNLAELGLLVDATVTTRRDMEAGAWQLRERHPKLTVMVTGGHLDRPDELLLPAAGGDHWIAGERVETTSTHGTGCALSSALLSRLVLGDDDLVATVAAKAYVAAALRTATPIGHGHGPMNLLWPLDGDSH